MNNNGNTDQTNTTNVTNAGSNVQTNPASVTGTIPTTVSSTVSNTVPNVVPVPEAQLSGTTPVTNSPVVNPTVPTAVSSGGETEVLGEASGSNGAAVTDEKLKSVEIDYKPPSKFKLVMTALLFVFLFFFIVFLPDITSMVNQYKASKNTPPDEIITTGKLECKLNSHTANLDMNYFKVFEFSDSKLFAAEYNVTTRGDATLDEATLDEMDLKCRELSSGTENLKGVTVSCKYSEGKLEETQSYEFGDIDFSLLDAAFTEAGGTYPEFKNGQAIEDIEKVMNASGYSCMRKK